MLKYTCVIKNYPTTVKVSNKARPKYWKASEIKNLPAKHEWKKIDNKGYLTDAAGNRFVKNSKTVGKPRFISINAQRIYVGLHHSVRETLVNELHQFLHTQFKAQFPTTIPVGNSKLGILVHFYDVNHSKLPDLDNLAGLFVKCGLDCLTSTSDPVKYPHKLGIIPDDSLQYIKFVGSEFTPIKDSADRKLEFTIFVSPIDYSFEHAIQQYSAG